MKKLEENVKPIEEKLEQINKTYGLSLSQIAVVKINDKEYLKFYDPITNVVKMIENGSQNLDEYFKELQQRLSFAQSDNELDNARNIFNYEEKYTRTVVNLIPVVDVEMNFENYTNGLDSESVRKVLFFVKNSKTLNISHINVKKCICVNTNQEVLYPELDKEKNAYVIKKAEVKVFEDKKVQVDADNYLLEIDGINFDEVVEGIDITVPGDSIVIAGEVIDINYLKNYIEYPELLEKQKDEITPKRKTILQYLIDAYMRKLNKNRQKQNENAKVLTLKLPNAYVDAFLLAIISSLAAALITFIVYF